MEDNKLRINKGCIKTLFNTLDKREKLIVKVIGKLDVASKTDIQRSLSQRLYNKDRSMEVRQYWFDKALFRLEAMMLIDSYKSGTRVVRQLTEEGRYIYNKMMVNSESVNGISID